MARRPSVFVRALSMDEGRKLQRVTRTAKDPVRLRRAIVVLMSGQGQAVRDITSLMQVSEDYVRDVIHAFNERGFAALDPKWSGGRTRAIGEAIRERICLIARTSPADWGITAFHTWSLAKLREHLLGRGTVAAISRETLRRILRDAGISWQTATTWKASTDPDFLVRMQRILDLYDHPPNDGRVICVDEFGPLNLMPRKGKAWRLQAKPLRLRATYNRCDGVMHMLAEPDPRPASPQIHPSALGPITRPRLRDKPLAVVDFPDDGSMRISHEAIYQALYVEARGALRRELVACLRTGRALRVPRARSRQKAWAHITPEVLISQRPAEADDRAVPGHWEGDLVIGLQRSAIGTLVERTTRFTMLVHLPREDGWGVIPRTKNGPALAGYGAVTMAGALSKTITELPEQLRRSLTWDRGKELSAHAQFTVQTGLPVYFADPHSPWQRGTNENTNGLLRQYFPKGTDLSRWSAEDIAAVATALNSRPRKTLGWKTPAEALDDHLRSVQGTGVASTD